jgi:hypothetical protein
LWKHSYSLSIFDSPERLPTKLVRSVPWSADMCPRSDERLSQSEAGKKNPDPAALKHPIAQVDAMVTPALENKTLPQSPVIKCSRAAMSNTLERPEALSIDMLSPLHIFEEIEVEESISLMGSELIASPPEICKFAAKHRRTSSDRVDLADVKWSADVKTSPDLSPSAFCHLLASSERCNLPDLSPSAFCHLLASSERCNLSGSSDVDITKTVVFSGVLPSFALFHLAELGDLGQSLLDIFDEPPSEVQEATANTVPENIPTVTPTFDDEGADMLYELFEVSSDNVKATKPNANEWHVDGMDSDGLHGMSKPKVYQ